MTLARRQPAQALVEAALVLPLLLMLAFGTIAVGQLIGARMAVDAVAREAAREAALAPLPPRGGSDDSYAARATRAGEQQGREVARGYGLGDTLTVVVDASPFGPGSWVEATATYVVPINVPIAREMLRPLLTRGGITVQARHIERVDPFRSRPAS